MLQPMPPRPRAARSPAAAALTRKIENRSARLAVIGLGYVGLPLAVEFAQAGFHVTGIDVDTSRVKQLLAGVSYIQDVPTSEVRALVRAGRLTATADFAALKRVNVVNVCVPTPLCVKVWLKGEPTGPLVVAGLPMAMTLQSTTPMVTFAVFESATPLLAL